MKQLTVGLNEQQLAAVTTQEEAVVVLAGPGSGKTRVLTHRIAYLIQEMDVRPWRVMAVTFTNKAAREMRERIEDIMGEDLRGLQVGTFHSICARILRTEVTEALPHYTRDFVIFDVDDQKSAVEQAMADLNLDTKKFKPTNMRNGISKAKNALIRPEEYAANTYIEEVVARIYRRYQEILIANNAMDFDDLLMNTVFMFQQNPHIAEKYQERYAHVLIDEFQDTNLTQYGIISQLVGPSNNIFIVGDADQSIYKWRGADIRNMQRFRKDFPEAQEIKLEQNYRSTQLILDVATEVIQHNQNRVHKDLFTERVGGDKIVLREAYNALEEADWIISTIQTLRLDGYNAADCAVMYRTNAQSRALEDGFVRAGIPYRLVGAVRFYGRREVKDVIAYLRIVHNPADEFSLKRVINVPKRAIGDKSFAKLRDWGLSYGWQPSEAILELVKTPERAPFKGKALANLLAFGKLYTKWVSMREEVPVAELLDMILDDVGYRDYIDDGEAEGAERWANVVEFRNVALIAGEMTLAAFLEEVSLVADADYSDGNQGTTLMTLHAAKGLEFPIVFIAGLEDGILPHSRSIGSGDPEEMDEERRLFYVGITRARDRLYLSYAFQRMTWGRTETAVPSRFLNELPVENLSSTGSSASVRRKQTINRASSWSWDSGSSGSGQSSYKKPTKTGRGRARPERSQKSKWDQYKEDSNKPKKKVSTRIPSSSEVKSKPARPATPATPPARPARKTEPEFSAGDRVTHGKFGPGIVMDSKLTGSDEEVTVAFESVGVKKLAASMARLEKLT